MKTEIKVPAMGESITEATIGTIMKASGSQVNMDDELLELETDKVNQALYASQKGTVTWNVSPDEVVKIGQLLGYIDSEGKSTQQETPPAPTKNAEKTPTETASISTTTPIPTPMPMPPQSSSIKEIPVTQNARISKESFLAEGSSEKTGTLSLESAPVEKVLENSSLKLKGESCAKESTSPSAQTSPNPSDLKERLETRRKMPKIRRVIAQRLVEAQRTTAMLTTFNEVDLSQVMALREKYKDLFLKTHGVKLGFMSFFVKAVVAALAEYPDLNSYIDGEEIVHREYYDIGIAVGSERGLFVPVVRSCERLTFSEIELAIEAYAKKARDGTLAVNDLQGGGFTITNGGVYGSLLSTPILNPPQSGILGMHKIMKRAVVIDDQIVIRPMMYVALSYDHRIIDGKEAVSFLIKVKNLLEDPVRFTLDL